MLPCPFDLLQAVRRRRRRWVRRCSSWRSWSARWTRRCLSWTGLGGCRRSRPVWIPGPRRRSAVEDCSEEESCWGGGSSMRGRFSGRSRAPGWKVKGGWYWITCLPVYLLWCHAELTPTDRICVFVSRCAGPADVRHLGFSSGERSEVHFRITGESYLVTPAPPRVPPLVLSTHPSNTCTSSCPSSCSLRGVNKVAQASFSSSSFTRILRYSQVWQDV